MTERDEMLALADKIGKQDFNSCDLYCERPYFLIVKALRLAAAPAPVQPKPLAWRYRYDNGERVSRWSLSDEEPEAFEHRTVEPLYAAPAPGVREALEKIITIDRHEKFITIECDPAGNTQSIEVVDGPCAVVARAALASGEGK